MFGSFITDLSRAMVEPKPYGEHQTALTKAHLKQEREA